MMHLLTFPSIRRQVVAVVVGLKEVDVASLVEAASLAHREIMVDVKEV